MFPYTISLGVDDEGGPEGVPELCRGIVICVMYISTQDLLQYMY